MASLEAQVGHTRQATETCHDTPQNETSDIDTVKMLLEPGKEQFKKIIEHKLMNITL